MQDAQIVELYWKRAETAISASGEKYGAMLKRISFNILSSHEDSEECVDDAYMNAWNTIPPQRPQSLGAYLGRIVRNLSINRWHENHAQKRYCGAQELLSELSDCIPSTKTVEGELEAAELSQRIRAWLALLSVDDRVLFLRRYWYGDSLKVLAQECQSSENKLAGRLYRLRTKLKTTLEREGVYI